MRQYTTRRGFQSEIVSELKDPANLILLCHDLHETTDKKKVWVPYPRGANGEYVLAAIHHTGWEELAWTFHGVKFYPIRYCRAEFLLARFAWVILSKLSDFLAAEKERLVVQVTLNDKCGHVPHIVARTEFPEVGKKNPIPPPLPSRQSRDSAAPISRKRASTINICEPTFARNNGSPEKRRKLSSASKLTSASTGSANHTPSPLLSPRLPPNRSPVLERKPELYPGENQIALIAQEALARERQHSSTVVTRMEYPEIYDELEENGVEVIQD
jgi:hypothetical protein